MLGYMIQHPRGMVFFFCLYFLFDNSANQSHREHSQPSDRFWREFETVEKCLAEHRPNSNLASHDRRVKIAVLDSGIDLNHPGIQKLIQNSSKWNPDRVVSKSFVGLEDSSDPHGHGTHVACTIMSIAQGAKLFVGGVVGRDKKPDPEALAEVGICCRTLPRWCNASL